MNLIIPKNYNPVLNLRDTEIAIKLVKDFFETELARALNLTRVSAPIMVTPESGLNDNLTGVERPVSFDVLETGAQVDGQVIFDLPDPRAAFEEHVVSTVKIDQFKERLTEKDRIILQMRHEDHTLQEIADAVGYKSPSAVKKRIDKIAAEYNDFVSAEYSDFLATHIK